MSDVKANEVENIEEFHANTFEPIEGAETPIKVDEPLQPIQEKVLETQIKEEKPVDETLKEPFDAAKHYQSIADKRLAELEREKVKREQLEAELNQFKQPKVEVKEPPKRPVFPTRPKDYDGTDAAINPDSLSYQFERAKEDYQIQKDIWDQYVESENFSLREQINKERQAVKETKEQAAHKAYMLGKIQEVGGVDIKKAEQIWDSYSTPKKDEDFLKHKSVRQHKENYRNLN